MLLVEDEPAVLAALKKYFTAEGFAVDCAQTLVQAMQLIGTTDYAIVIADLRLSWSDSAEGLDVLRLVREHAPETPVIILTAYAAPEIEHNARALGAQAFLQKPVPLPAIAEEVRRLIGVAS